MNLNSQGNQLSPQELVEIDRICDEFESVFDKPPSVVEFLEKYKENVNSTSLLRELLVADIRLRARHNYKVLSRQDYKEQFPDNHEQIDSVFALIEGQRSTSRASGDKQGETVDLQINPVNESTVAFGKSDRKAASQPATAIGDYELLGELGRGGMGIVYKARQVGLDRTVALKTIKAGEFASEEEVKRFHAEAEAAAALDHPGIVPVFDVGEHDSVHFFSMGYVEGRSLGRLLRDGPVETKRAAELVQQIATAVAYAHERGIVHRDLKPDNVLLDTNWEPRVTDFGLAKRMTADEAMTATGAVMGTPSYMPPEQASGGEVGMHSDVYSLGAILYACLVGRPPHQSPNVMDTLLAVLNKEPALPRSIDSNIPRDLETICLKAINKDPSRRYESVKALAADLGRWLNNEPITARRVGRLEKAVLWCRRYPMIASLIVLVASVIAISTGISIERLNAGHARGLVDSLLKAEPQQVSGLIDQIEDYRWWTQTDVEERMRNAKDDSRDKLLLRLTLLRFDQNQVQELLEPLLTSKLTELGFIRQELQAFAPALSKRLWEEFRNGENDPRRFRAGLALAQYAAKEELWKDEDYSFLVNQLVSAFPEQQPLLRGYVRPISGKLIPSLTKIFRDSNTTERNQDGSASAIADFAQWNVKELSLLALEGTGPQYLRLFPVIQSRIDTPTRKLLQAFVGRKPKSNYSEAMRVKLGRLRASAAITLLRLGARREIFDVFRVTEDPESLTQFVHRCKDRGVSAAELLECLQLADHDRQSLAFEDDARMLEDRVIFGLLLSLGDYSLGELPEESRDDLVKQLVDWYAHDPRSGIHGASGWLLRTWGREEAAEKIDQTPVAYEPGREWYVEKIDVKSGGVLGFGGKSASIYLTMIVFPAGEFMMGTPPNEADHENDQAQHQVRISRPLAISDREISWGQWDVYDGGEFHQTMNRQFSGRTFDESYPVFGRSWFDAVDYCRRLNKSAGISSTRECYVNPEESRGQVAWQLRLSGRGFRLPTEAEWERMARSDTTTPFSFGTDRDWLGHYAWCLDNSQDWSHPVGKLRPNLRGLFDVHGNLYEWCHDWYRYEFDSDSTDPTGAHEGSARVYRGGSWMYPAKFSRSGDRSGLRPSLQHSNLGFRVAQAPPLENQQARLRAIASRPQTAEVKPTTPGNELK